MFSDIRYRSGLIVLIIIASLYLIWPTYQLYSLSSDEKNKLDLSELKNLKKSAINLGLDLQGGMYVLLEVDIPVLVEKIASKKSIELKELIKQTNQNSINNQADFFNELLMIVNANEIRLSRFYTNLSTSRDNEAVINELKRQRDNAIASALEIIRNRIDEFGVSEPNIQKYGENRIIVELAGVQDSDRARKLIQRTASLEFTLVLNHKWDIIIDKLDKYLVEHPIGKINSQKDIFV